jgi:hypothetical protein
MRIFAYVTPECASDAAKHGFSSEVTALQQKIELDQSTGSWDRVLPSPFIRKKLGTFRLVAEQRHAAESVIVCFRALMARGDSKYSAFIANPAGFWPELDEGELAAWRRSRMATAPPSDEAPSADESVFLYGSNRSDEGPFVFETAEWVERVGKLPREARGWLLDLLRGVIDGDYEAPVAKSASGVSVIFRTLPPRGDTLLIAPLIGGNDAQQEMAALLSANASVLEAVSPAEIHVRRMSRRAYPTLVLADNSLWFAIEGDDAANLALSPEELGVLESVFFDGDAPHEISPRFPLFINGRPGSGKSTVLQYMFAEFLSQYLAQGGHGDGDQPLYLTYSEELLRQAVTSVEKLVKCNASIQLGAGAVGSAAVHRGVQRSFRLLHEYVRELLPDEEARSFAPERRLTFPAFRRMWYQRARAARFRRLSPELVWHVLRTYIKGMRDDSSDCLDVEGYKELPAKRRTVPIDTYQQVYEDVWCGWFGETCESEGLWDDQDLTRRALDVQGQELARHPVVFCDEAQDFTRNELELIARLSLFTKRSLSPQEVRRVPIAFAGDPFQTLNPTGFQWASVGARFHEQIVKELDPTERCNITFNFQELAFNYRSSAPIVGFCNLIQVIRGVLFDIGSLKPQLTWSNDAAPHPALFSSDDAATMSKLAEQDEIVIIIPCQEGEEESYIASDAHLTAVAAGGTMRNIVSPMAAKGLEFSRVVLYKFGHDCISNYPEIPKALFSFTAVSDPEISLPMEYFINRLYVASSRPKRRLFVIDSAEAIRQFWGAEEFRDAGRLLAALPHAESNGWRESDIANLRPGVDEDWTADRDDPLMLAEQFFSQGQTTRSAYLLQMAEANFLRAGTPQKASLCAAHRLELQEDFSEAGRLFLEVHRVDDAIRCLWRGQSFPDLAAIVVAGDRPEVRAARFMTSSRGSVTECEAMLAYMSDLAGSVGAKALHGKGWLSVLNRLVEGLGASADSTESAELYYHQLVSLERHGLKVPHAPEYGDIAYAASDYPRAVEIWGPASTGRNSERRAKYEHARAYSDPFPQNLQWLAALGRDDLVLSELRKRAPTKVESEPIETIVRAAVAQNDPEAAVDWCRAADESTHALLNLLAGATASFSAERYNELIGDSMKLALSRGDWGAAIGIASDDRHPQAQRRSYVEWLVVEVANSNQLAHNARKEERERVARFLTGLAEALSPGDSVQMRALGAAIERTGQIVLSLGFYERVWKRRDDAWKGPDRRYADQRWVRCKLRQAERSKQAGKRLEAREQEREAEIHIHSLGVRIGEIPEFVIIDVVPDIRAPQGPRVELTPTQVRAAKDLARASAEWTPSSIAQMLGVPEELVAQILKAP